MNHKYYLQELILTHWITFNIYKWIESKLSKIRLFNNIIKEATQDKILQKFQK